MKTQIFTLTLIAFLLSSSGCTVKTTTCTTKEQKKVKTLKTELSTTQKQIKSKKDELNKLNSQIKSAKKKIKATNSQILKSKIDASKIEKQTKVKADELTSIKGQIKNKIVELNNLNSQIGSKKQEFAKLEIQKSSLSKTGKQLYKRCLSCHGVGAEKSALGRSQIIAGWSEDRIINALNGYKDGTYGGSMAIIMKGQVTPLEQIEIQTLAKYISSFSAPKSQKSFPSFSKSKSFKFKCINLEKKQKFEISLNANKQVNIKTQGESQLLPIVSWQKDSDKYLTLIPEFDGSYSLYENGNLTFASEFTDEVVDSTCERIE